MWCAEAKAKIDIPLIDRVIKAGEIITVTKGGNEMYALWDKSIYDLPEIYVGEIVRFITN